MKLQFINPEASVKAGDLLVSYGVTGGVFTPGLPLGKVTYVETAQGTESAVATVEPFVRISSLDVVGVVVTKPRNDPRDSLIPQVTAAPTVTVTVTPQPTMSATVSASATKSGA